MGGVPWSAVSEKGLVRSGRTLLHTGSCMYVRKRERESKGKKNQIKTVTSKEA